MYEVEIMNVSELSRKAKKERGFAAGRGVRAVGVFESAGRMSDAPPVKR
jgi:hypothetical protein